MQVVLTQDVPGLGKAGEIKEVDDNYARDDLLPKGYAALAPKVLIKQSQQGREDEQKRSFKSPTDVGWTPPTFIGLYVVEITRFDGSITNGDIAKEMRAKYNLNIDPNKIKLDEPITEAGEYSVLVDVSPIAKAWIRIVIGGRYSNVVEEPQATTPLDFTLAEVELLQKINQGLPSELGQRYSALIEKRDAEDLTSDEHEELLDLTDQVEQLEAQRVEYLVELARLRNTTVTELIQELGIRPSVYV
ncbi:MAG TPA: 50S ribosomal protein L9 [Herpetosiphonaceae bacterium]